MLIGLVRFDSQAQGTGAIRGTVTDETGNPLEEIVIRAEVLDTENNEQWNEAGVTQSDSSGQYTLCCLSEADYRLSFLDAGARYLTEYYDDVLPPEVFGPDTVTMVHVTAAMTTTAINAALAHPSIVAGTITDPAKQPLNQIAVDLYRYDRIGDDWKKLDALFTDSSGHYRSEVLPGRYRLHFYDPQPDPAYLEEYYADATSFDTAKEITITKEITAVVDVTLQPAAAITGTLTNHSGEPAVGVAVVLYQFEEEVGWVPAVETQSNATGNYRVGNLAAGVYRVHFTDKRSTPLYDSEFYNNVAGVVEATDITVAVGETVINISAELADLSQIRGTITNEKGEPLGAIAVIALRYTDTGNGTPFWQEVGTAESDVDGTYELIGLQSGSYQLIFYDGSNTYQSEWYDNAGYEATANAIALAPETTLTGINAQLTAEPFTWPPIALADSALVAEGGTTAQTLQGELSVLTNDLREQGEELQGQVVTQPQHGTLQFQANGSFRYRHDGSETTSDSFTYRASDGVQASNVATVTITVQPVNDVPVATDDAIVVTQGESTSSLVGGNMSLLANDRDVDDTTLTATILQKPAHGSITLRADGTFHYVHNGEAVTSDLFTYQVHDTADATATGTVRITVELVPLPVLGLTLQKTVGIAGFTPACTAATQVKVPVGTAIAYCYTVQNTGEVTLTTHSLVDSHLGQLLNNVGLALAPGTKYTTIFTQTIAVTTTNVATWTASTMAGAFNRLEPLSTSSQQAATVHISGPTDDADHDTIPDNVEGVGDPDRDNIPNYRDLDADNDTIPDQEEAGPDPHNPLDSNGDGIPDYLDSAPQLPTNYSLWLPVVQK